MIRPAKMSQNACEWKPEKTISGGAPTARRASRKNAIAVTWSGQAPVDQSMIAKAVTPAARATFGGMPVGASATASARSAARAAILVLRAVDSEVMRALYGLRNARSWDDPSCRLVCDRSDPIVVSVVVNDDDSVLFRDRSDEQIG